MYEYSSDNATCGGEVSPSFTSFNDRHRFPLDGGGSDVRISKRNDRISIENVRLSVDFCRFLFFSRLFYEVFVIDRTFAKTK